MMSTGSERKRKFSTGLQSEVQNLEWTIYDFKKMVSQVEPLKLAKLTFDAGNTIHLPTKWEFYLTTDDIQSGELGIYLQLLDLPDGHEEISADFDYVIKNINGIDFDRSESNGPDDYKAQHMTFGYDDCFGHLSNLPDNVLKNDGSLVIDLTFKLFNFSNNENPSVITSVSYNKKARLQEKSVNAVSDDLRELLHNGSNSDFKIIMKKDGKEFPVHRNILISRSPVFSAMFDSNMTEASSGILQVEELSSETMEVLLEFMYSGNIANKWKDVAEELVYASEKYMLPLLKEFLDSTLVETANPENAMELLKVARKFNLETAAKEISVYASQNFDKILDIAL